MSRISGRYERLISSRKDRLLQGLVGRVLEIGPGTGPNLRFLAPEAFWIGVEPNRHMYGYLAEEARRRRRSIHVIQGSAEALPLADRSVGIVLATLVLCSVDAPERTLLEIHRVLEPGGRFVFIEHVAAPPGSWLRRGQRWIRPAWRRVADGCRPDRETDRLIREAGFDRVEMERFRLPLPLVSPHVAGMAWKDGGARDAARDDPPT